jgi:ABC-type multidrug transport system ATPase subunit
MMTIILSDTGKRFNREWIFRHLNYTFETGKSYAITGANGSGKSTLLQAIAGALTTTTGEISYTLNEQKLPAEQVYRQLAIAAPYLELIEEMTATELLQFHQQFKPLLPGHSIAAILQTVALEHSANKQIRFFSSGMKQRLKLAQAFFSDTPILLLDEPCTNLDAAGISLYHQLIQEFTANRLLIISSNDPQEYSCCGEEVRMGGGEQ